MRRTPSKGLISSMGSSRDWAHERGFSNWPRRPPCQSPSRDFERSADEDAGVGTELVEVARDRFVDDDFLVVPRGMHEAHFTDLVLQRETDMGAKSAVVFCHDLGGVVEP